jgi:hemerythrin-like domain-containing protein
VAARKKARGRRSSGKEVGRSRRTRRTRPQDAIALLREDHARVQEMFDRFERTRGDERKQRLVEQICLELEVHATIEEEIFYPAVREAIRGQDLMDEAEVEHQSAKALIRQLEAMSPGDELYDAKVKVLGEYVKHHVKEEQNEMFPQARAAELDLAELGDRMRQRKEQLMSGSPLGVVRRMMM